MISNHNLGAIMGAPVQGNDDKIGTVGQIFVDPASGNPNWITVHTGLFGRHETFVPLDDATWDHEVLHVPFDKKTIKDAPRIDTDEALSPAHEADLYRYYRVGGDDDQSREAETPVTPEQGPLRLRKYVVTEDQEVTVPVEHEEVRVETEGDVQVDTGNAPEVDVVREQRPGRHAKE